MLLQQKNPRLDGSTEYFKIVINRIYNTLKSLYDENKMEDNFKEAEKLYTKTVVCFKDWLYKYSSKTDRINTNLRNKPVYNLSEQDYYKSIIDFIAGMTDNFAMDIYNEIISFLNRNFKW